MQPPTRRRRVGRNTISREHLTFSRSRSDNFRAVYIRSIDTKSERVAAIDKLIGEIAETNCQLVLAPDTVFAAAHAAAEKFISTDALAAIREEKQENEIAPSAREIGEQEI